MERESQYRIKQIDKMAKDIYKALLTPKDVEIRYQARYKAAICYALPVTLFNAQQLHRIQQRFIHHYLPKISINRNTPWSVVYGPVSMGGMEIMVLRLEQPISVFHTMLGHIWREDNAGKTIIANLYNTQIEVGITKVFYNEDIIKYAYITTNTRW